MKYLTPDSARLTDDHLAIFAQGADYVVVDTHHSAGLWHSHTPTHLGEKLGCIGACRLSEKEHPEQFLSACADFLNTTHGCHQVAGPMNGNTWLQHRLVIESNDHAPFMMEPVEPAFFQQSFAAAGFQTLSTYCSQLIDLCNQQCDTTRLMTRFAAREITLRSISDTHFKDDLNAIFELSISSFSRNFLYTPISQQAFVGKYLSSRELIDSDLVILAEKKGELLGYIFCMPDHLAAKYGNPPAIILKTLACKPDDKSISGLGALLVNEAHRIAFSKGYTEAIHALQHEENYSSTRISERYAAAKFRRYALMIKSYPDTLNESS